MSLGRAVATVGGFTLLSRVVGFIRDIVLSAMLGSGAVADAFFVAFKLPNFFRRLFAEGAFSAAFVPLFARELQGHGRDAALAFARQAHAGLLLVLVPFIPMVLMLRFMLDALEGERDAAFERAAGLYQQTVVNAGPSLAKHLAARTGTDADRDLYPRLVATTVIAATNVCQQHFIRTGATADMKALLTEALRQLSAGLPEPGA